MLADAGAGKSRLLYEFLNWVELEPSVAYLFSGRSFANRVNTALGLFRDVVASRFSIQDSDTPSTVATKLRDGFASRLAPPEAEVVGRWLGFELPPSGGVQRLVGAELAVTARTHFLEYLGSLAAHDPVVLALEDLHWADDESLELLVDLLAQLSDHRGARASGWPGGRCSIGVPTGRATPGTRPVSTCCR